MNVRPAVQADAPVISALIKDVQTLHAQALPFLFKPYSDQTFPAEKVQALMAELANIFLLAEVDGQPAGYVFAAIRTQPEDGARYAFTHLYLNQISVQPAYRRHGCGAALIAALKAQARERGIDYFALDVWSFNVEAQAFFREQGFTAFNERLWLTVAAQPVV